MTKPATEQSVARARGVPGRPFKLIGELMNNAFARARRAWAKRDLNAYQKLARLQTEKGADALTFNLDGTQTLMVRPEEMIEFIPELIPAIQSASNLPLSFDNPDVNFHRACLAVYDPAKSGRSIFNSVSASRGNLEAMYELIAEYDTRVVIMASEKLVDGSSRQCLSGEEVHQSARYFVDVLRKKTGRRNEDIIIDPGLAPVSADTYGLVNMGLEGIRLIRNDSDLAGVHISVGLTNFSFGVPRKIRVGLENAYVTIAVEAGLDYVLGNPEKDLKILDADDRYLQVVREALALGKPKDGESREEAGFRQSEKIMDLF